MRHLDVLQIPILTVGPVLGVTSSFENMLSLRSKSVPPCVREDLSYLTISMYFFQLYVHIIQLTPMIYIRNNLPYDCYIWYLVGPVLLAQDFTTRRV